jgi:uncharacterized protein YegL
VAKIPLCFCIDSSASTYEFKGFIERYLSFFFHVLKSDEELADLCEICIITYGNSVKVFIPFASVYKIPKLRLEFGGPSPVSKALELAFETIDAKLHQYDQEKELYAEPLLFILTDGESTDEVSSFNRQLFNLNLKQKTLILPILFRSNQMVNKNLQQVTKFKARILSEDELLKIFKIIKQIQLQLLNSESNEKLMS